MGRHELTRDSLGRAQVGAVCWSLFYNAWLKRTGIWTYIIVATDEDVERARAANLG